MKQFELKASKQKSFNGKAIVKEYEDIKMNYQDNIIKLEKVFDLYSYNTLVARVSIIDNAYRYHELFLNDNVDRELLFSNTTLKHIKEFLRLFNDEFKHINSKSDMVVQGKIINIKEL